MFSTSLTVWHYDSAMGAAAGEVRLKDLEQLGGLRVIDAVTVAWMTGSHAPRVGHLHHRTTTSAARGSVLGALVGALVLAPAAGAAAGAGIAAISQKVSGSGIDAPFLEDITARLTPGTSALLVLSKDADLDVVRPFIERGLARGDVTLMHASLGKDGMQALRSLLPRPDAPGH